jgi:hypothetical protein
MHGITTMDMRNASVCCNSDANASWRRSQPIFGLGGVEHLSEAGPVDVEWRWGRGAQSGAVQYRDPVRSGKQREMGLMKQAA